MDKTTQQPSYRTWKMGTDIDTDQIVPGRYAPYMRPNEDVATAAFVEAHPKFNRLAKPGDVIVAGENFGCGSSREYAPLALARRGLAGVVAKSFARIFYRNAVNLGLPVFVEPDLVDQIQDDVSVSIDLAKHTMVVDGISLPMKPLPDFAMRIIEAGGIAAVVRETKCFPDELVQ